MNYKITSDLLYYNNFKDKYNIEYIDIATFPNSELKINIPILPQKITKIDIIHTVSSAESFLALGYICDQIRYYYNIKEIHLITPYLGYARQDRRTDQHRSLSIKIILDTIAYRGIKSLTTIDLHSNRIIELASIPIFNIDPSGIFTDALINKNIVKSNQWIVVGPDEGARKRTQIFAKFLNMSYVILKKVRMDQKISFNESNQEDILLLNKKNIVLCDDIIDTAGTLIDCIKFLKKQGVMKIVCIATHGVFSGDAIGKLQQIYSQGMIEKIYIGDTCKNYKQIPFIEIIPLNNLY